jgi:hypothetical protein
MACVPVVWALAGCGASSKPASSEAVLAPGMGRYTPVVAPPHRTPDWFAALERVCMRVDPALPSRGPAHAKVTVQLVSNIECALCVSAVQGFDEPNAARQTGSLFRAYRNAAVTVRVVFQPTLIVGGTAWPDAERALHVAFEAKRQRGNEGFWCVHDRVSSALTDRRASITMPMLMSVARQCRLDEQQAQIAVDTRRHLELLEAQTRRVVDTGLGQGVPEYLIGDRLLAGMASEKLLRETIEEQAMQQELGRVHCEEVASN